MKFGDKELTKNVECTLKGVVVFMTFGAGTKSESLQPYLYQGRDAKVRVFKKGDNPFENHGFDAFDGKEVEVVGAFGRGDVFNVSEIKVLGDAPAVADAAKAEEAAK